MNLNRSEYKNQLFWSFIRLLNFKEIQFQKKTIDRLLCTRYFCKLAYYESSNFQQEVNCASNFTKSFFEKFYLFPSVSFVCKCWNLRKVLREKKRIYCNRWIYFNFAKKCESEVNLIKNMKQYFQFVPVSWHVAYVMGIISI